MLTGTWDDDDVMPTGPLLAHAHARWIPACPCSCPMDPRTPVPMPAKSLHAVPVPVPAGSQHTVSVPAGSLHACAHARWVPTRLCPCPMDPCMPVFMPAGPLHAVPVPVPAGSQHTVSVPAGSLHTCAHACWVPARPCSCPLDPCTPCLCPCLLDPSMPCPCPLDPSTPCPCPLDPSMLCPCPLDPSTPCLCLLDPRTPEFVPADPRMLCPCLCPMDPCTHARTHRVPTPACLQGPCMRSLVGCPYMHTPGLCTRICVCWMHHVCIPQLYVLGGLYVVVVICSSSSTVL